MDKHKTESVASSNNNCNKKKQKRLGPAPIASFEDISDEVRQKVCITVSSSFSLVFLLPYNSLFFCCILFLFVSFILLTLPIRVTKYYVHTIVHYIVSHT